MPSPADEPTASLVPNDQTRIGLRPSDDGSTQSRPPDGALVTRAQSDDFATTDAPASAAHAGTGPLVAGRYELAEVIGRGGMGLVYRARDTLLGREVAVKTLVCAPADTPLHARRFLAEARIAARLQHPAIPPVHDRGTLPDGRPFIAMKLIRGQTLAQLLANRPELSHALPQLLQAFEAVAQAVGFAHLRGVIHRDLKPANVMVGAFGEVQVMDWGLAKVVTSPERDEASLAPLRGDPRERPEAEPADELLEMDAAADTRPGAVLGTPAYMPPEQARGDTALVSARSDVFSLGGVLCEILTGKPPNTGALRDTFVRLADGNLTDAHARLDSCGGAAELVALTKACLSADPAARPADGEAVAGAVAAYRLGAEERLRRVQLAHAAERAAGRERRKRRWIILPLTAFVFLLLSAGGTFTYDQVVRLFVGDRGSREWVAAVEKNRELEAALDAERRASELAGRRAEAEFTQAVERADAAHRDGQRDVAWAHLRSAQAWLFEIPPGRRATSAARHDQRAKDFRVAGNIAFTRERAWGLVEKGTAIVAIPTHPYQAQFSEYGLRVGEADSAQIAGTVRSSFVAAHLIAGLDDWLNAATDQKLRDAIADVLRHADADPARTALCAALAAGDSKRAAEAVRAVDVTKLTPEFAATIGGNALLPRAKRVRILRQIVARTTGQFGPVYRLAVLLTEGTEPTERAEAVGQFRTAAALRPTLIGVRTRLGEVLHAAGDLDGAIAAYQEELRLSPRSARTHHGLGLSLLAKGKHLAALLAFNAAARSNPGAYGHLATPPIAPAPRPKNP